MVFVAALGVAACPTNLLLYNWWGLISELALCSDAQARLRQWPAPCTRVPTSPLNIFPLRQVRPSMTLLPGSKRIFSDCLFDFCLLRTSISLVSRSRSLLPSARAAPLGHKSYTARKPPQRGRQREASKYDAAFVTWQSHFLLYPFVYLRIPSKEPLVLSAFAQLQLLLPHRTDRTDRTESSLFVQSPFQPSLHGFIR